jgi:hypothetical protein
MTAFCTKCGSALSATTRYCTNCGTENLIDTNQGMAPAAVAGVEPAGAAVPGSSKPKKSRRWLWWVLALILVFALGFFLGHRTAPKCPPCPAPSAAGAGGGGGGGGSGHPKAGAGGNGDHDKGGGGSASGLGRVLGDGGRVDGGGGGGSAGSGKGTGDMAGGGTYTADGTVVGHGNNSTETGASGSDDDNDGGSGGKGNPSQAPNGPESDLAAKKRTEAGVWRLAAGGTLSADGVDTPQTNAKAASNNVLTAHDFRYDKTNLPRYPESVKDVVSAISYPPGGRTDTYGTSSGIVTSSPFDTVVDWYRKNLPPGWHDTTISDFGALAKQLSPENIMKMIGSQAGGSAAPPGSAAPATAPPEKLKISMFRPPAGSNTDTGVMIIQKGDQPVEVFMRAHVKP